MSQNDIKDEFTEIFESLKTSHFNHATLFNLDDYLTNAYSDANKQASELIPKHLFILEQATTCMLLFNKYISHGKANNQSNAFRIQMSRATNSLISARELLKNGFEDTAKVITRNYFETLDILFAIIVDKNFADEFFPDNSNGFDDLWKNKIGYGKIYEYTREIYKLAGKTTEDAEEHIKIRREQKNVLSASVHADTAGAFLSHNMPVLGYPDLFAMNSHGVISVHTVNHIKSLINETYKYIGIILKCLFSDKLKHIDCFIQESEIIDPFLVQSLTFQEIFMKYDLEEAENIVAKDYIEKANKSLERNI